VRSPAIDYLYDPDNTAMLPHEALASLLQSLRSVSSLSESRWQTLRQGAHGGVIH
jgi:hypothetical protein